MNFISLTCPSCGAKLQVTSDMDRFACSFCGNEQLVRREGGTISLKPVLGKISEVKTGVDITTAELAISRLRADIADLNRQMIIFQARLGKAYSVLKYSLTFFLGGGILIWLFPSLSTMALLFLVAGVVLLLLGAVRVDRAKESISTISAEINQKEGQILSKSNFINRASGQ